MKQERNGRKARVKKETVRQLDLRTLAPKDLEEVLGGYLRKPYTCDCPTSC